MSTCVSSPSLAMASVAAAIFRFGSRCRSTSASFASPSYRSHPFLLRAANESKKSEQLAVEERSEADKIVDGMDFGELCNEFECISSPLVESTARQLLKDIIDLPKPDRTPTLGNFAVFVKYKDPFRKFSGREKYKRQVWAVTALDNLTVSVQEMVMLSRSELKIKWIIKGKAKTLIVGDLIIKVESKFILNQISGQVIEHEEGWDVSSSSTISQAFFWASRYLFASTESAKDFAHSLKTITTSFSAPKQNNLEIFPDPSADPTKFFQSDDSFQRDVYQIALLLAVLYFVVQFLRTTL